MSSGRNGRAIRRRERSSVSRRKRLPPPEQAADAMAEYVRAYRMEQYLADYTRKTYLLDMLYGLGVSLGPFGSDYRFAGGFDKFKAELRELLDK
jgi:hypothetical protein